MMRPFLLLLAVVPLAAQSLRIGPVYPNSFPNLEIVVEADRPVTAEALTLLEDGVAAGRAVNLRRFHETGEGVAVGVLIDASGSMRGRPMEAIRQGLSGFVSRARSYDQIAIASVANEVRWEADWKTPREELAKALQSLQARGTLTHLWDGIAATLQKLSGEELPARRRLVVISDGYDEGSETTLAAVTAQAARQRIPVDCIGITRANPVHLRNLEELARKTGGNFRAAADTESLKDQIAGGIQRLLDTPVARFRAKRLQADGNTHDIGVRWDTGALTDSEAVTLPRSVSTPFRWGWAVAAGIGVILLLAVLRRPRRTGALPPPPARIEPRPVDLPAATPAFVPSTGATNVVQHLDPVDDPRIPARRKTEFAYAFQPPAPHRPAAWLRGLQGPAAEWRIPIHSNEFWIGAAPNNHCTLELDESVSANHACIRFEGSSLRVYDNRSTNGTWVNQLRVADSARLLSPGDRLKIGKSTFAVEPES
jgi:Mg-chelatase subunit ChlD